MQAFAKGFDEKIFSSNLMKSIHVVGQVRGLHMNGMRVGYYIVESAELYGLQVKVFDF